MRAVNVREAAVEVDHFLTVRLQRELFNVCHVEARCVVDGVDANGECLVGELFTIAGTQSHHRFTVHITVNGLVANGVSTKFNRDEFRIRVLQDLEGQG